ncbi:MAG: hypothetical protein ACRD32_01465 [Nitrososphaerales archaeon]
MSRKQNSPCGHYFQSEKCDIRFQSKDFARLLDKISEGEDTRTLKPKNWLWKSNFFFGKNSKGYISEKKAKQLAKNKKKYNIRISDDGKSVCLYKNFGSRPVNFVKENAIFNMYVTCPKCKKVFDAKGIIKDYIFIGQLGLKRIKNPPKTVRLVVNEYTWRRLQELMKKDDLDDLDQLISLLVTKSERVDWF